MKSYDLALVAYLCRKARRHAAAAQRHVKAANAHNACATEAIGGAR